MNSDVNADAIWTVSAVAGQSRRLSVHFYEIGLVTSQNQFRWIKRKSLADLLLEEDNSEEVVTEGQADDAPGGGSG